MGLVISNNVASLTAQNNISKTNSMLSSSLEKLSTGLKINRGADGPAALVISEQQRAQIAGLRTAIDNTNKAVSMVQTAEGALNEINRLLGKIRGLALDSANTGVNDATSLAANQAEITNAINTINNIANTTKFGASKFLLNGQSGTTASVTGANNGNLGALKAGVGAVAGAHTVALTQGTGGFVTGPAGAGSMGTAGSVIVSGGGLSQGMTVALAAGDNVASAVTKIQAALDNAGAIGGGAGKFVVSSAAGAITIRSNVLGSAAINVTSDSAGTATVVGFANGAGTTGTAGTAAVVTVDGQAASISAGSQGLNNFVTYGGSEGISFYLGVTNGATAATGNTTINVADQSLTFQIGANANEMARVSIDKMTADVLGSGVSGLSNPSTTNLSLITVLSASGSQDAIKIVDQAISDVSSLRGKLGAFQANTLESNANNLRATLENTTAAESVIRDTDFAAEIANFTKLQTQMQAGSTVLGNANQMTALVAQLLRG
jgi:flagellin